MHRSMQAVSGRHVVLVVLVTSRKIELGVEHEVAKDENETEISRTEPHCFLYLIRSNLYFLVLLYRFRFRI